jgi:hypothetical protein
MAVLVGLHLGESEHGVLALPAVVVGLLPVVAAASRGTVLQTRDSHQLFNSIWTQSLGYQSVSH